MKNKYKGELHEPFLRFNIIILGTPLFINNTLIKVN